MSNGKDANVCEFCADGKVITREEELTFHQSTDRGYVFCRVQIPIGTCQGCGTKTWNEEAEAIIERTVREEYGKLP